MHSIHRKRVKHYDMPGHAHFLTFSCYRRQTLLCHDRTRQWLVDAIGRAQKKHGFDLWAWVIMPEHVHLLLWSDTPTRTAEILRSIKVPVAKRAMDYLRHQAPAFLNRLACVTAGKVEYRFWQAGPGFDRNITEPALLYEIIDYIHHNPVKRGLVATPGDWSWSSYRECHGLEPGKLMLNHSSLPVFLERIS